jgi:hypothetical protein
MISSWRLNLGDFGNDLYHPAFRLRVDGDGGDGGR